MFGWFKSPPFTDQQLGEFTRSGGHWRGMITIAAGSSVPLVLAGNRSEPDKQALQIARGVPAQFESWRPLIEDALFEHLSPYAEAVVAGDYPQPAEPIQEIAAPGQVWPYVSLINVAVTPLDGLLTVELAYTTAWDEEHTLGARFRDGGFLELCGSILLP